MAIRNILNEREDALHRVCRPVTNFDERLWQLLDDMAETLHKADGCGLAAPQVGILRRAFVMDFGDGIIEVINPEIVERKGKQEDVEGCLSCPGNSVLPAAPAVSSSRHRTVTERNSPWKGRTWWRVASVMKRIIWMESFSRSM